MIKCFKNLIFLYYLISIFGAAIVWLLLGWITNIYIGGLAAILWIVVVILIMSIFALKKTNKIINIMLDYCNVEEYIRICNKILVNQTDKRLRTVFMLYLAAGYINIGNTELAEKMLNSINGFDNSKLGARNLVTYYGNLVAYYFQIKDIENVVDSMKEFKAALDNKKLSQAHRNKLKYSYSDSECLLNMANNIYDGAEQVFNDALSREKHMLGKVSVKYTLGLIYLHDNRPSEASEAFEFAAKNGGNSLFNKRAKEQLEKLHNI